MDTCRCWIYIFVDTAIVQSKRLLRAAYAQYICPVTKALSSKLQSFYHLTNVLFLLFESICHAVVLSPYTCNFATALPPFATRQSQWELFGSPSELTSQRQRQLSVCQRARDLWVNGEGGGSYKRKITLGSDHVEFEKYENGMNVNLTERGGCAPTVWTSDVHCALTLFARCLFSRLKKKRQKYDYTSWNPVRPKVAFHSGQSITLVEEFFKVKFD